MKFEITHSCGHVENIELFGPMKQRYAKVERMEQEPCIECRAAAATARDEERGLVALKGSAKQVAWASDLRIRLADGIDAIAMTGDERTKLAAKKAVDLVNMRDEASFWIENHQRFEARALVEQVARTLDK